MVFDRVIIVIELKCDNKLDSNYLIFQFQWLYLPHKPYPVWLRVNYETFYIIS